ncbi:MAG: hypothetical protein M3Q85_03740 [Acidobacteriota bacterium]|nr:hypothetical protein [Acidobacteriota bacterium]
MRMHLILMIPGFLLLAAPPVGAGTVTRVSVAPDKVVAGGTVAVTVSGTNPCGAAHITYGDGEAVTYAITGLPYTQNHVYARAGTYTITGRGMGNCDGEVTTSVTATAPPSQAPQPPPPPTPPSAQISAVDMAPTPGRVGEPVTIAVNGSGTCTYEVHYGDGNVQDVTGQLPQQFRHTYAVPEKYTVIVKPSPPCAGRFTQVLQVVSAQPQQARISRVLISPSPVLAGQPVDITVEGAGTCGFTIEYGDGNDESRSAALPDRLRHVYPAAGRYEVVARASAPCLGEARARVDARREGRRR